MIGFVVDIKYYLDVKNLGAAITFASPYIFGGVGALSKSESNTTLSAPNSDSSFSVSLGVGLEFPIVFRSSYFALEGRYFTQSFSDTNTDEFKLRVTDLSGGFYTITGSLLFVW